MSATPITRYSLADLRKAAPGRGRVVPRRSDPALEAWYRQLHQQILGERRPVSGRAGRYVYYWAYGRLCWRAYVVPKDPRTVVQRRSRSSSIAPPKSEKPALVSGLWVLVRLSRLVPSPAPPRALDEDGANDRLRRGDRRDADEDEVRHVGREYADGAQPNQDRFQRREIPTKEAKKCLTAR